MSSTGHQDIEGNQSFDNHSTGRQPQSVWNQESLPLPREERYGDSSGQFFSVYSRIAKEKDDKMTERWQKDADGMLVFTGLFSAAVAALLAVSIQDLRPDPQETTTFYLAKIYQVLADANLPQASIPSPSIDPPKFSPPKYAILVNSLWFLSLVISLICALLATSLHQWARRYVRVTQPARCSPEKRARMRAFFAGGMDNMRFPSAVDALPSLLHLSLFLFFSGLVIFLLNVNQSVFLSVIWCIGLCATVYGIITFMPMFRPDSPYYTPLSTPASFLSAYTLKFIIIIVNVVLFCCVWITAPIYAAVYFCFSWAWAIIRSCTRLNCNRGSQDGNAHNADLNVIKRKTWQRFVWLPDRLPSIMRFIWDAMLPSAYGIWNIEKAAEQATSKRSSEIDLGILDWTLGVLGEDDTLEEFFKSIPGFFNSMLVKVSKISTSPRYIELYIPLRNALVGFLRRTLSSNSISESVKNSRLDVYFDAMNAIYIPYHVDGALTTMIVQEFSQLPRSIETGRTLTRWLTADNQSIGMAARYGVATILGAIKNRDLHWFALANEFGLSERELQDNIKHSNDSVLLAIFLHVTRQVYHTDPWNPEILSSLLKFDINETRLELRIEFCDLWNQIAIKADEMRHPYFNVLREIHSHYRALHRGAFRAEILTRPWFYPRCDIAIHYRDAPTHLLSQPPDSSRVASYPPLPSRGSPLPSPSPSPSPSPLSNNDPNRLVSNVSRSSSTVDIYVAVQGPDENEQQDMATPPVASHIGATLQTTEETTGLPPAVFSNSLSFVPPNRFVHSPGPLSSSLSPTHSTSVLDAITRTGSLRAHERDETRNEIPLIPTGVSLPVQQSELSTHEIAEDAEPPGERRHDQN